jgi:hypothetical protein
MDAIFDMPPGLKKRSRNKNLDSGLHPMCSGMNAHPRSSGAVTKKAFTHAREWT